MREIKYRGKAVMPIEELDKKGFEHDNGWVVGNLIQNGNEPWIVGNIVESDPEYIVHDFWVRVHLDSVGQYTNLIGYYYKDFIYEDDVLSYEDGYGDHHQGLVVFDAGEFYFRPISKLKMYDVLLSVINSFCEIIGNQYENPELLK